MTRQNRILGREILSFILLNSFLLVQLVSIEKQPQINIIIIPSGKPVFIPCEVESTPIKSDIIKIFYSKDPAEYQFAELNISTDNYFISKSNPGLVIGAVGDQHAGIYYCEITNSITGLVKNSKIRTNLTVFTGLFHRSLFFKCELVFHNS